MSATKTTPKLDTFTRSYIETMLWESTGGPNGDRPLDRDYGVDDFDPKTLARIIADCAAFQEECSDWYDNSKRAGHDFWLTRVGSGAGFWDGDYPEPQATLLTNASKRFGHVDVSEGEYGAGPLYLEPSVAEARKHARRLDADAFKQPSPASHATRRVAGAKKSPAQLNREIAQALASRRGSAHSTIRSDEPLYPTAEARRGVQTIRRREDFPEILAISMRADGTNYQVKVPDPKNKHGYDLVDVLVHHNGLRSTKSASRSRITPTSASKIVSRYLEATR